MKYILNCAIFPDFDSATSKNGEKNDKFAKKFVNLLFRTIFRFYEKILPLCACSCALCRLYKRHD